MVVPICNIRLEELTKLANLREGFLMSLCIMNLVFSIIAVLGNLLVICALWKASLIPRSLRKLFLSLAFSDLLVGVLVQPIHASIIAVILHMEADGNNNTEFFCPIIVTVYLFSAYLFSGASFLSIVAIAVDRLLAVSLHLRYHEFVTSKRMNVVLALLWSTSFLITSIYISLPKYNDIVAVVFEVFGILVTSAAYFRIYKIARYHQNKICSQFQIAKMNASERQNVAQVRVATLNTFFIFAVFFVFYMPNVVCGILLGISHDNMSHIVSFYITIFVIYLNSSINFVIYCWRFREIRDFAKTTLKKILPLSEHEPIQKTVTAQRKNAVIEHLL